ncbi:hypothetical protein K474DRAFT_1690101 [Panus rudis PR-1116 ss-1]|nr:hypothetical protein K474DRAFT_1690101 [Panus rudis PR-1116 ss-1]
MRGSTRATKRFTLEVCIDSVESALAAARGGANRVELCANLGMGGGTTPSLGLFKAVRDAIPSIPVMVMIRPRAGDFLYTSRELEVMLEDIHIFQEMGADGVVFGVLTADGDIDVEKTQRLSVCFHRAFDMTRDSFFYDPNERQFSSSLQAIVSIDGIHRILTSGHRTKAPTALPIFRALSQQLPKLNEGRSIPLTIMPGSGINQQTVGPLLEELLPLGLQEVHLSAGGWLPSGMRHRPEGMEMGIPGEGEWAIWQTDEHSVRAVREAVDNFLQSQSKDTTRVAYINRDSQ